MRHSHEGGDVLSYPDGTFVPIAIATHGLVGLTLGLVLFERPWAGLVAGLFPDGDFLFPEALGWPFVHRGLTHGLLVLAVVAGIATAVDRRAGGAVAAAYASHLCLDLTVAPGVPLVWPLTSEQFLLDVGIGGHALPVTAALWVGCLALVAGQTDWSRCWS
jgi:inner membrane protein